MKFLPNLAASFAVAMPLTIGFAALPGAVAMAANGPIETACNRSERRAANRALCDCIQGVADATLGGSDQRRVATFFKDPDKAQDVKMSKTNADDAFWDRYKAYGNAAEASCG